MEVPERIGPYEILRELGRGGMAIVYLAREPDEGTLIALKVLPTTWTNDLHRLKRFQREAATVMRVRHPNIVPTYSVGCVDGLRFIAMKYIEGSSLDLLIRDQVTTGSGLDRTVVVSRHEPAAAARGPADAGRGQAAWQGSDVRIGPAISWLRGSGGATFGPPISSSCDSPESNLGPPPTCMSERDWVHRAVVVVETIARALDHVHQQGIVHRDIKPGNIIIDSFGDAWLADFGLVRDLEAPGLSQPEALLGTIQYMAPEQVRGDVARTDHRIDIYALGVTLYELVTLRRPFDGRDSTSILHAVASEPPVAPRKVNPRLTDALERVIKKAMARTPDSRYQSGCAFADDLRRLLTPRRGTVAPPLVSTGERRFGGRSTALSGAVVFLVVLVLGLLAFCVLGAVSDRQRLLGCKTEADQAFDRGDYRAAAESYRLYLKLGGDDSAVIQRLSICQDAPDGAAPK